METKKPKIMVKPLTKSQFPKTIGKCIDKLFEMREAKRHYSHIEDEFNTAMLELEDFMIMKFKKQKMEGARGTLAQASISKKIIPIIDDFNKFKRWVFKHKNLSVLQRRLASNTITEFWDNNKSIPGVGKLTRIKISLTKISK